MKNISNQFKIFFSLICATCFIFPRVLFADITNPYTIDEKSQIFFGDSIATSTYQGLENYTHGYIGGYLHIRFTYTHSRFAVSDYPPRLYVTATDPTGTSIPGERDRSIIYQLLAIPVPPGHETDWYLYDVQFDSTGYMALVKEAGEAEVANFHHDIIGIMDGDWVSLANLFPIQNPSIQFSMSFPPLSIHEAPIASTAATSTPVIIVPGIMGSYLNENSPSGLEIWPDIAQLISSITDVHLENLSLDSDGESLNQIYPSSIIKALGNHNFFEGLFSTLANQGYIENKNLFGYSYDWRKDIRILALGLKEQIDQVKTETGVEKINLVAHSMGGLLVKEYLKEYGDNSVDKFIDVGTPHTGSPKSLKILNYGDNFGFEKVGLNILNPDRTKSISQNMLSVYELLPSQRYFTDSDQNYYVFDGSNGINGNSRLDFSHTSEYLKSQGRNVALVDRANEFHQEIDGLNPADYGTQAYNIVGCGTPTIGRFYILDSVLDHPIYNILMVDGDGTVPVKSAQAMLASTTYYVKNTKHALLPSVSGVKELIAELLAATGTPSFNISPYSNLATDVSECGIPNGKIVSFHSPIELHVYDQLNNHAGPDAEGNIENNVPGLEYETVGDNKFAFLPDGADYTIKGRATAEGAFDVRIQEIINGEVASTTLFTQIPLTADTQATFILGSTTPSVIDTDSNNDGIFEGINHLSYVGTRILESTGHPAIVPVMVQNSSNQSNSKPVIQEEIKGYEKPPIPSVVSGVVEIIPASIAVHKDRIEIIKPEVLQPQDSSDRIEVGDSNTAIVYKSFTYKVFTFFKRIWLWIISRL